MDAASNKISELQLSQYRSMKNYEELEIKHSDLSGEIETEKKLHEAGKMDLRSAKEQNVELTSSIQEYRKWTACEIHVLRVYTFFRSQCTSDYSRS